MSRARREGTPDLGPVEPPRRPMDAPSSYSWADLSDLAERGQDEARPCAVRGGFVGVALPDWPGLAPCAVWPAERARRLAAQLLLAADELDAIQNAALVEAERAREPGTPR